MSTALAKPLSLEEFLAWEDRQDERYELSNGTVRLMTGSTRRHDAIRMAILNSLFNQLKGKPCHVHADIKIVCRSGNVRYPDAAVNCGSPPGTETWLDAPKVVVEVLSPSTQAIDYIQKTSDYASVPSIETYLIVSQDEPRIDIIERTEKGFLPVRQVSAMEDVIELPSIGAVLSLSEIYLPQD
jgi:Uma2 family endonuclease